MILIGLLALFCSDGFSYIPRPNNNVDDQVQLITSEDFGEIDDLIRVAYQLHDSPIVVCTINSMSEFTSENVTIEEFAMQVFNDWDIGTLNREDGHNKGILFLVSVGDRKARIELGAEWGLRWDAYCQSIMDSEIIPAFKQNNYSKGIRRGVYSLSKMAELGPGAEPPAPGLIERLQEGKPLTPMTPIPGGIAMIMIVCGAALIILSIFMPEQRKWLLIIGGGLIFCGVALYVLFAIFALFARGNGSSTDGSGGFSGGIGGGGFSGGGGASGSW